MSIEIKMNGISVRHNTGLRREETDRGISSATTHTSVITIYAANSRGPRRIARPALPALSALLGTLGTHTCGTPATKLGRRRRRCVDPRARVAIYFLESRCPSCATGESLPSTRDVSLGTRRASGTGNLASSARLAVARLYSSTGEMCQGICARCGIVDRTGSVSTARTDVRANVIAIVMIATGLLLTISRVSRAPYHVQAGREFSSYMARRDATSDGTGERSEQVEARRRRGQRLAALHRAPRAIGRGDA